MTQGEKAKTYDEALERAKECLKDGTITTIARDYIWKIFPELQESEDEKIRKEFCKDIRTFIPNEKANKYIAWLEKQGEKKPNEWHCEDEQCIGCINDKGCVTCVDGNMKETNGKPKFKVSDWLQYRNAKPFFVEEITKQGYINGVSCLPFEWEDEIHLWTIQDAKDGDVLVASDGSIFLFAGVDDCACKYYVALTTDNYVKINKKPKGGYWETSKAVYPATKEQQNLFFEEKKETRKSLN